MANLSSEETSLTNLGHPLVLLVVVSLVNLYPIKGAANSSWPWMDYNVITVVFQTTYQNEKISCARMSSEFTGHVCAMVSPSAVCKVAQVGVWARSMVAEVTQPSFHHARLSSVIIAPSPSDPTCDIKVRWCLTALLEVWSFNSAIWGLFTGWSDRIVAGNASSLLLKLTWHYGL